MRFSVVIGLMPSTSVNAVKSSGYSAKGGEVSDDAFKDIVAGFLKEIAFQGGLNVNVNLTVNFKGLG